MSLPPVAPISNIVRGYLRCYALCRPSGSDTSHISGYAKYPLGTLRDSSGNFALSAHVGRNAIKKLGDGTSSNTVYLVL